MKPQPIHPLVHITYLACITSLLVGCYFTLFCNHPTTIGFIIGLICLILILDNYAGICFPRKH